MSEWPDVDSFIWDENEIWLFLLDLSSGSESSFEDIFHNYFN